MSVLSGIPRETSKSAGGILEVYVTEFSNISGATTANGIASFGTEAGVWSLYVLGKEAGSNFVSNGTTDVAAGTTQYEQLLTMIFKRNQVSKRNELKVLAQNELVFIVNDNDAPKSVTGDCTIGNTYIIGLAICNNTGGADVSSSVQATGSQYAEANNMTITLRALETHPPLAISDDDYVLIKAGNALTP